MGLAGLLPPVRDVPSVRGHAPAPTPSLDPGSVPPRRVPELSVCFRESHIHTQRGEIQHGNHTKHSRKKLSRGVGQGHGVAKRYGQGDSVLCIRVLLPCDGPPQGSPPNRVGHAACRAMDPCSHQIGRHVGLARTCRLKKSVTQMEEWAVEREAVQPTVPLVCRPRSGGWHCP